MRRSNDEWAAAAAGRLIRATTARPVVTMLAVLVLVVLGILAALRLGIDTDSSGMLSADLPFRQRLAALDEAFPKTRDSVIVVVRSETADAADAVVSALAGKLEARHDVFDWVYAPSADPFFVSHGLLYMSVDQLEDRLTRLGRAAGLLAALRVDQSLSNFLQSIGTGTMLASQAGAGLDALQPVYAETADVLAAEREGRSRPFAWSGLLSGPQAGHAVRVIDVGPKLDYSSLQPAEPALLAIDQAIAGLDPALASHVEIGVTGDPALRAEELESVTQTLPLSMAVSMVAVAVLLYLALGSLTRMALTLGSLVITLVLTAGFAGIAIGALNLVSVAFVVLMVGLGIDYAIHFVAHFDEHRGGSDRRAALVETGRVVGPALILSTATTALAFFAFGTTKFVGMAQLGLIGGVGVIVALLVTLTVIPAGIMLWPRLDSGRVPRPLPRPSPGVTRALRILAVVLGLAGIGLVPFARFAADPMALRNPQAPSVQAYRWLDEDPALTPMRLSLVVGDDQAAKDVVAALKPLPEVGDARWIGDFVPARQDEKLKLIDLASPSLRHAVEGEPQRFGPQRDRHPRLPRRPARRTAGRGGAQAGGRAPRLREEADAGHGRSPFGRPLPLFPDDDRPSGGAARRRHRHPGRAARGTAGTLRLGGWPAAGRDHTERQPRHAGRAGGLRPGGRGRGARRRRAARRDPRRRGGRDLRDPRGGGPVPRRLRPDRLADAAQHPARRRDTRAAHDGGGRDGGDHRRPRHAVQLCQRHRPAPADRHRDRQRRPRGAAGEPGDGIGVRHLGAPAPFCSAR